MKILGWAPADPTSIRASAARGGAGKAVALGFANRLTISLAGAPAGRGGKVFVQGVDGRLLAQGAYRAGQGMVELPWGSGRPGLGFVRILPSR